MAHYEAYIARYGDRDFNEMPFNEVDGLIFSQLAYVDYAGIVGGADAQFQTLLDDAARQYFALHPAEEIDNEIGIVQKAIYLLQLCADTRRYGNTRLSAYVNNVNIKIDKQFSAVGFHLNDGSLLVAFRGTDTSITGVKESAMLSYMFPVPAQIEALYYFQETASLTEGDVRVCGHSKGGNLAVFAAVSCSNSLKKRIRGVYEYDAPGFPEPMVHRYDYLEMRDRLFSYVPERSVIGCLLEHNADTKIVQSENEGLKQHQAASWVVEDDRFCYVPSRDDASLFIEKYIKMVMDDVGPENMETVFETLFDFFESAGITDYEALRSFDAGDMLRTLYSVTGITEDQRHLLEHTLKLAVSDLSRLLYKEKIESYIKRLDAVIAPEEASRTKSGLRRTSREKKEPADKVKKEKEERKEPKPKEKAKKEPKQKKEKPAKPANK